MSDTETVVKVTAKGNLNGHAIEAEALNPGGWFGRTWLLEIGGSYWPLFLCVEAGSMEDAIDELSDSKFGHLIHVEDDNLGDYPENDRQYDSSGRVIDTQWVGIHGDDLPGHRTAGQPWHCTYYADNLPTEGISPRIYDDYLAWVAEDPRKKPQ